MVADYIFEKDKLFANLNLSDDELALYERQFQYFRDQLPIPDLVIYLQTSPKVLRTRLTRKGVPEEQAIPPLPGAGGRGLPALFLPLHCQRFADW